MDQDWHSSSTIGEFLARRRARAEGENIKDGLDEEFEEVPELHDTSWSMPLGLAIPLYIFLFVLLISFCRGPHDSCSGGRDEDCMFERSIDSLVDQYQYRY